MVVLCRACVPPLVHLKTITAFLSVDPRLNSQPSGCGRMAHQAVPLLFRLHFFQSLLSPPNRKEEYAECSDCIPIA